MPWVEWVLTLQRNILPFKMQWTTHPTRQSHPRWPDSSVNTSMKTSNLAATPWPSENSALLLFFISLINYWRLKWLLSVQSVQRLTTGWTVRGSNPGGARFSARPDRLWCPPSLLYNGYRVFPGGKVWPGRAADHLPHSSAAVMQE